MYGVCVVNVKVFANFRLLSFKRKNSKNDRLEILAVYSGFSNLKVVFGLDDLTSDSIRGKKRKYYVDATITTEIVLLYV